MSGLLTATEERVAQIVAKGRTNREAATELHVSAKTIEWHLSRIYRKEGVRSRTELALRLAGASGVRGNPLGLVARAVEPKSPLRSGRQRGFMSREKGVSLGERASASRSPGRTA